MKVSELIGIRPGITSVIGSGGKTSLLSRLAEELPGKVILTTTTHILPFPDIPLLECGGDPQEDLRMVRESLMKERVLCVGTKDPAGSGKLSAPSFPLCELLPYADYILAEADGSKRLPIKAHEKYEPVIPKGSGFTVNVVGASGIGKSISECCHRPLLFCRLTDAVPEDLLSPALLQKALVRENLGDLILINQCDTLSAGNRQALFSEFSNSRKPVCAGSFYKNYFARL